MKEIRLVVAVKNNILISFREAKGFNQRDMAAFCGMSPSRYGEIENLKVYPLTKKNEWNEDAKRIAIATKLPEDILFPEALEYIEKTKTSVEIGIDQLQEFQTNLQLESPEEVVDSLLCKAEIQLALGNLPPREAEVIKRRFGIDCEEETLKEIGERLFISTARARQIELTALRKIRGIRSSSRRMMVRNGKSSTDILLEFYDPEKALEFTYDENGDYNNTGF